jgi:carboxypeptidase C (cathepsin A)
VLGPWRLPLDGPTISPSASPALVSNAETWLDFTDLVFIDRSAPATAWRGLGRGSAQPLFQHRGRHRSLSEVVARWLRSRDRLLSPKFFVGESYGGFRGPKLANALRSEHGVALSGMVLLSPVLDFAWLSQPRHNAWVHVGRPALAFAAAT